MPFSNTQPDHGPRKGGIFPFLLTAAVWGYLVAVVGVWVLLRLGGDRWWLATVMLFGPRWIYGLPLMLLVPLALFLRRRLLVPLAIAGAIVVFPIAGLCLPWARWTASPGARIRVLTCNVQVKQVDRDALAALVERLQPDLVAIQEYFLDEPLDWPEGWQVERRGPLVVASPHPVSDVEFSHHWFPSNEWPQANGLRCTVSMPHGDVRLVNVHLQSPRRGLGPVLSRRTIIDPSRRGVLEKVIDVRREEAVALRRWIGTSAEPVVVAGDFNTPADSIIQREVWGPYHNAFSEAGFGFGMTKRSRIRSLLYDSRIDHILSITAQPIRCWVGPDVGSDHRPLIADLRIKSTNR